MNINKGIIATKITWNTHSSTKYFAADVDDVESEETDEEEDSIPQTAQEIVASGTISEVCDVSITMQSLDTEDEITLLHVFYRRSLPLPRMCVC